MPSMFKRVLAILAVLTMCAPLAHAGGLERRGSLKDGPYGAYPWTGDYIGVTAG